MGDFFLGDPGVSAREKYNMTINPSQPCINPSLNLTSQYAISWLEIPLLSIET